MKKEMIKIENVGKTYEEKTINYKVLENINLNINKGEFVVLLGKSGSGKSTLLNLIGGIDSPTTGEVIVGDVPVHSLNSNQSAVWRGRNVGIVFQFFQLMPTLTTLENVMLPMEFTNSINSNKRKERAVKLLEKVGLEKMMNKFPNTLSGGEKQRAAIARALANNPDIILADEPTGNLDSVNAKMIYKIFNELKNEGKTIVYITHDGEIKVDYSRLLKIADGNIIENQINV